ncbi:MAG: hypothetical protein IPN70_00425 [Candidatus Moraniibacteriota bacterium]|nr:MAG: hypothetical protein IPN70_00425 [Candidatus Moranbacteria bacterium]
MKKYDTPYLFGGAFSLFLFITGILLLFLFFSSKVFAATTPDGLLWNEIYKEKITSWNSKNFFACRVNEETGRLHGCVKKSSEMEFGKPYIVTDGKNRLSDEMPGTWTADDETACGIFINPTRYVPIVFRGKFGQCS